MNYKKAFDTMVSETAKYLSGNGLKTMILGLSGGLDSTVTAAICHDIGKTRELSAFPENSYTDEGQLLGHIVIGCEMLAEKIREIPGFPEKKAAELRHCIIAHHGEYEFGSPKKPALIEAMALNLADNTDAKMETFREILVQAGDNSGWLGFNRFLDSNLRKTSE